MINKIRSFLTDKSASSIKKRALASALIFTGLIVSIIFILPWQDILNVLYNSNISLILIAYLITSPTLYLDALSFKVITDQQNMGLSVFRIMILNMIVSFYQLFIPATFFGSGLRWYRFSQSSKRPVQSLTSIAYYKLVDIFLTLLLSFGFLFLTDVETIRGNLVEIILVIITIAASLPLTQVVSRFILKRIPAIKERTPQNAFFNRIFEFVNKILLSFSEFGNLKYRDQFRIVFLALASQTVYFIGYFFMAKSVGIIIPFTKLGVIYSLTMLAARLPINFTPTIGLNDISLVALLNAYGVELKYAVAMSLIVFGRKIIVSLIGGILEAIEFLRKNLLIFPRP
jgi:uncharacterized protein (TIRG00374 family)